jgi:hypothetical protein
LVPPRDTSTGDVLEQMIIPALRRGQYLFKKQQPVGLRPGGGRHRVDAVASDSAGRVILISMKWQQVSGTAEQKVPFEVMCLAHTLKENPGRYAAAYLVLGGEGWTLRDYYISGGLNEYMHNIEGVTILSLEDFIAKANHGKL